MKFVKFKNIALVLVAVLSLQTSFAQDSTKYPQDYFLFPINPGQRNYLAGSMGELRPNHFHGGLDIKTGGVEGLPVLASADGYVERVKVNSYGYGWVMYVKHPNGYTTTYAHLKKFRDDITEYVRSQQYNRESFSVDLFPKIDMLKVQKGDTIAWSGNTGSSGGPHLHFEIRDKNNFAVNPLLFGFDEIIDNTSPTFTKVAISPLEMYSMVENKYERKEYSLSRVGSVFTVKDTVDANGIVGIDFAGFDRLDGASNKNGITYVTLKCNDSSYFVQALEKFSFEKGRTFNTHIDYRHYRKKGKRFQHCFLEDGNTHHFYGPSINRGKINIEAGKIYNITISAKDSYLNESVLKMVVRGTQPTLKKPILKESNYHPMSWTLKENVLDIGIKNFYSDTIKGVTYADSSQTKFPISYYDASTAHYLWDMRRGMPDSVRLADSILRFDFKKAILPFQENTYSDSNIFMYFPKNAVFDTLYLDTEYDEKKQVWRASNILVPMLKNASITLKVPESLRHPKASVYSKNWKSESYIGTTWTETGAKFRTRSLGQWVIRKDENAPYIKLNIKKPNYISFKISDDKSGIASYRATLNGNWILMKYDHKRNLLYVEEDWWSKTLKGEFKLVLKDNMGNETVYETTF